MKYSFTCSCGDETTVDAATREEAVQKIKDMMNDEAVAAHMAEKHSGQQAPTKEQVDVQIEQNVRGVTETPAAA